MSLAEHVKAEAEAIKSFRPNSKFNYCCSQHLVAEFGVEFKEVLDHRRGEGPAKQCFANSFKLALADESLTYCEGYATGPKIGGIPVHHAWCVNKQGQVIDVTTTNCEEYFGIPFTKDAMIRHCLSDEEIRKLCAQPGVTESK